MRSFEIGAAIVIAVLLATSKAPTATPVLYLSPTDDLCKAVTESRSLPYLHSETSGGILKMEDPMPISPGLAAFLQADPAFADMKRYQVQPLGPDGAGIASYYDGSAYDQYVIIFDRVNGHLREVDEPDVGPGTEGDGYAYAATIGGVPVLFSNRDKEKQTITKIVPWRNHKWGKPCEIVSPAPWLSGN